MSPSSLYFPPSADGIVPLVQPSPGAVTHVQDAGPLTSSTAGKLSCWGCKSGNTCNASSGNGSSVVPKGSDPLSPAQGSYVIYGSDRLPPVPLPERDEIVN